MGKSKNNKKNDYRRNGGSDRRMLDYYDGEVQDTARRLGIDEQPKRRSPDERSERKAPDSAVSPVVLYMADTFREQISRFINAENDERIGLVRELFTVGGRFPAKVNTAVDTESRYAAYQLDRNCRANAKDPTAWRRLSGTILLWDTQENRPGFLIQAYVAPYNGGLVGGYRISVYTATGEDRTAALSWRSDKDSTDR